MKEPVDFRELRGPISAERTAKINARAAEIMAHDLTLREVRKLQKLTQSDVAKAMGVTQDKISLLEKREDALVSTLRNAAEALGGELKLVITFKGQHPVVLQGFGAPLKKSKKVAARQKYAKPTAVRERALAVGGSLSSD